MNRRDDTTLPEGVPAEAGRVAGEGQTAVGEPRPPRVERKRRKVSLIAAIVVNVVTVLTVAIILLAVLMPGYRRSFTIARAVKGSDDVWIVVKISESAVRQNSTDFIPAQDGLKNALQELVGGGDNVRTFVRDNFPDQAWIEENLPENMRQWLQQLYPKVNEGQVNPKEAAPSEEEGLQPGGGKAAQASAE